MRIAAHGLALSFLLVVGVSVVLGSDDLGVLINDLADPDHDRYTAAFTRLAFDGPSPQLAAVIKSGELIDALGGILNHPDRGVRMRGLSVVISRAVWPSPGRVFLRDQAFELLRARAAVESYATSRARIASGFGSVAVAGSMPMLESMSVERDGRVRTAALRAMGALGGADPAFLDHITPYLADRLSTAVAEIVAKGGGDGTASAIMSAFRDLDARRVLDLMAAAHRSAPRSLAVEYVWTCEALAWQERYDEIDPEIPGAVPAQRHPYAIRREDSARAMAMLRTAQSHPNEKTSRMARASVAKIEASDIRHADAAAAFAAQSASKSPAPE
jgi:hypothetical protein